jgi:hypothetical protein
VPSDFFEFVQRASFPGKDIFGGFGRGEGLRLGVVLPQVVVDRGLQIADTGVTAPADAL